MNQIESKKLIKMFLSSMIFIGLTLIACEKDKTRTIDLSYSPIIQAENFTQSTELTNPFFLFDEGSVYVYEGLTEDGFEHIEVYRTEESKMVMGIPCVVVRDQVWLNNTLHEDTRDWYAQDNDGNVWYMGEDVDNYNDDGSIKDHDGAWEAGVDGAKPGIVMLAAPDVGMKYRQEYYFNHAEDQAEVLAIDAMVTTVYGTFDNCLQTHEWTELDKDANEHKFYAPNVGLIREYSLDDDEEIVLIDIR